MTADRIVLHHLNGSRGSRIVWLLEELEVEYEINAYVRTNEGKAPPELETVWPLGLSPVVQIFKSGVAKPITLAESGQIVQYLISHYDPEGKFLPESDEDQVLVDYYLHFAEGSLQCHLVSIMISHFACLRAPRGAGWLVKNVTAKINASYYGPKAKTAFEFLNKQLDDKKGGFFVGDKLSAADFILGFPVSESLFCKTESLMGMCLAVKAAGINGEAFPKLAEWNKLITDRPALIRASERCKEAEVSAVKKAS